MEWLLSHLEDVEISWSPGCSHLGGNNYAIGAIGRTGPKEEKIWWTKPSIPKALVVYVKFKCQEESSSAECHMAEFLRKDFQQLIDPDLYIEYTKPYQRVERTPKEEYQSIFQAEQERQKKIQILMLDLEDLGVCTDNLSIKSSVPAECYSERIICDHKLQ